MRPSYLYNRNSYTDKMGIFILRQSPLWSSQNKDAIPPLPLSLWNSHHEEKTVSWPSHFIMKWKDCLYVEMGHVLATGYLHPSCWCATTRNGVFSASSSATTINNYHPQWQLLSSWVPVYCHHLLSRPSFSTIPHKEQYCLGGIAINHFIQASICWLNRVKWWIYDQ